MFILRVHIGNPFIWKKHPKNKESLWIEWQCGWFLMPGEELYAWCSFSDVIVQEWKRNSCQDNSMKYKYNTICTCQSSLRVSDASQGFVLVAVIIYLVNSTDNLHTKKWLGCWKIHLEKNKVLNNLNDLRVIFSYFHLCKWVLYHRLSGKWPLCCTCQVQ